MFYCVKAQRWCPSAPFNWTCPAHAGYSRSLRQCGSKARTSLDQLHGAPSLLTLGILGFSIQFFTCYPSSTWTPPQTVPVFVLGNHMQCLDKKHPRSPGCQSTELAFFLVGVWRVQLNSENWGLSKLLDRHINLNHQRATDTKAVLPLYPLQHTETSRENEMILETVIPDV